MNKSFEAFQAKAKHTTSKQLLESITGGNMASCHSNREKGSGMATGRRTY